MPLIPDSSTASLWMTTAALGYDKPFGLESSPDGSKLYVSCAGATPSSGGALLSIDIATKSVTAITTGRQYIRHGIAVVQWNGDVWFAHGVRSTSTDATMTLWDGSSFTDITAEDGDMGMTAHDTGSSGSGLIYTIWQSSFGAAVIGRDPATGEQHYIGGLDDNTNSQIRGMGATNSWVILADRKSNYVRLKNRPPGSAPTSNTNFGHGVPTGVHAVSDSEAYILCQDGTLFRLNPTALSTTVLTTGLPTNGSGYADIHVTSSGRCFVTCGGWNAAPAGAQPLDSVQGSDVGIYEIPIPIVTTFGPFLGRIVIGSAASAASVPGPVFIGRTNMGPTAGIYPRRLARHTTTQLVLTDPQHAALVTLTSGGAYSSTSSLTSIDPANVYQHYQFGSSHLYRVENATGNETQRISAASPPTVSSVSFSSHRPGIVYPSTNAYSPATATTVVSIANPGSNEIMVITDNGTTISMGTPISGLASINNTRSTVGVITSTTGFVYSFGRARYFDISGTTLSNGSYTEQTIAPPFGSTWGSDHASYLPGSDHMLRVGTLHDGSTWHMYAQRITLNAGADTFSPASVTIAPPAGYGVDSNTDAVVVRSEYANVFFLFVKLSDDGGSTYDGFVYTIDSTTLSVSAPLALPEAMILSGSRTFDAIPVDTSAGRIAVATQGPSSTWWLATLELDL